ncbi:MAG: hypothetical protein M1818_006680 [Claussenomyces sp. TS43310]|nr:MAG: hypothetical protein M1818_006888 [Claussenomyces sp. TS43310]KAI9735102.1 MAG: hypothetical protein M1818_006680 [Claussenomyces sp. TS43310]
MAQKCVHQACGKSYTDPEEECHYHPGPPIFHEGQKGWKCCKPRVLTFDEFLAIPPCTTGKHSTTDAPPALEKPQPAPEPAPTVAPAPAPAPSQPSRAPIATPQASAPPPAAEVSDSDDPALEIPDGKTCRRKACGQQHAAGKSRDGEKCVYHPGAPIFHEGSKGYTCCKRRVLDFDEFMNIEGCKTKSRHLFVGSGKKKGAGSASGEEMVDNVRHDFYQTPTSVIASIFLKKINKDAASVLFSDPTTLTLDLPTTDTPPKRYKKAVQLFAPIDTEQSSFKIMGTKLELVLVKADGSSWPVLRADEPRTGEIFQVGKAGKAT